jgi:hypothetical protein
VAETLRLLRAWVVQTCLLSRMLVWKVFGPLGVAGCLDLPE